MAVGDVHLGEWPWFGRWWRSVDDNVALIAGRRQWTAGSALTLDLPTVRRRHVICYRASGGAGSHRRVTVWIWRDWLDAGDDSLSALRARRAGDVNQRYR